VEKGGLETIGGKTVALKIPCRKDKVGLEYTRWLHRGEETFRTTGKKSFLTREKLGGRRKGKISNSKCGRRKNRQVGKTKKTNPSPRSGKADSRKKRGIGLHSGGPHRGNKHIPAIAVGGERLQKGLERPKK